MLCQKDVGDPLSSTGRTWRGAIEIYWLTICLPRQWTHARTRAFTKESPFQMGFDPLLHLVGLKKDLRLNMPEGMNEAHFVDTTDVSSFLHLLSLRSAMALQKPSWGGGSDDEDGVPVLTEDVSVK